MQSLPTPFRALIIGASGTIGGAIATRLRADPRCGEVLALGRAARPPSILITRPAWRRRYGQCGCQASCTWW